MDCHQTTELLPWLVNDSLEGDEKRIVVEHLASCEDCRRELESTIETCHMLATHVPSLALAEYAVGLTPSGVSQERIERHLAVCHSCNEELALAVSEEPAISEGVEYKAPLRQQHGHTQHGRTRHGRMQPGSTQPGGQLVVGKPRVASYMRRASWAVAAVAVFALGARFWLPEEPRLADSPIAPSDSYATLPANGGAVLFSDNFESGSVVGWSVVEDSVSENSVQETKIRQNQTPRS